jgi:hypothetical protein
MPEYRYYLSRNPGMPSPPTDELLSVQAESQAGAIETLRQSGNTPGDWPEVWAHFLVWSSEDGEQRGFESIRLR